MTSHETVGDPEAAWRAELRQSWHRTLILDALAVAREPLTAASLAQAFDLTPGAVAHHLRQLREAGMAEIERSEAFGGREVFYWRRSAGEMNEDYAVRAMALLRACSLLVTFERDSKLPELTTLDRKAIADVDRLINELRPRMKKIIKQSLARHSSNSVCASDSG